jgi:hypothetical protein
MLRRAPLKMSLYINTIQHIDVSFRTTRKGPQYRTEMKGYLGLTAFWKGWLKSPKATGRRINS